MSRTAAARAILVAQGLDLVTFGIAILAFGVPIGVESNPLFAGAFLRSGIVLVAALKIALVAVMLALAARLDRHLVVGVAIIAAIGLLGAVSNVWTSVIWLSLD